jgi:AraC-like DNA-binding protein/ligand-binding sensor protein
VDRYQYIEAYIDYLSRQHGLSIAVKDYAGFAAKDPAVALGLTGHCIHTSPFCLYLKSHGPLWDRCQAQSRALGRRCREGGCFAGICYAGFSELVLPVTYQGRVIAAVCAGGFELDEAESLRRRSRIAREHKVDLGAMEAHYQSSMTAHALDLDAFEAAAGLLADFCRMYYAALAGAGVVDPNVTLVGDSTQLGILTNVVEYVHLHFDQDIRLKDIAAFCRCSESYVSHLFNRNMHVNLSLFVNRVRVTHAKRMLAEGGVDIIQPDLSHAGGILEVKKIAAMAEAYDVAVAPHCPLGPIALASALQLDFCTPNCFIQEQSLGIHYNQGSDLMDYLKDPEVFRYQNGYVNKLTAPGLGIEVDEEKIREMAKTGHDWKNPVWRTEDGVVAEW